MTRTAVQRGTLRGPQGVGIASTAVDPGSGNLIVTLTNNVEVDAGHVRGPIGPGVNFENSVADVASLPASPAPLSAYYVQADGNLYVFEGSGAANDGKTGYTNVGRIRGEQGLQGIQGPQGIPGVQGIQGLQGMRGPGLYPVSTIPADLSPYILGDVLLLPNGDYHKIEDI